MIKWDIVVIGAGPAGSFAAKTAAENGCRVLLLEEHRAIGQPRHCPGWLLGTEFTEKIVTSLKDRIPFQKIHAFHFYNAESGKLIFEIPDTGWGGYLVNRQLFDREIALLALQAGAKLSIQTKAEDLIRDEGRVIGVRTNSKRMPEIMAEVVICADGIRSLHNGFARKELIIKEEKEEEYLAGVLVELNGVKDVRPGIIEGYESPDVTLSGRNLWVLAEDVCSLTLPNVNLFWDLQKREDNLFSRKIRDAQPTQVNGYFMRYDLGRFCDKVVDNGVVFVGDASGNSGIIHGMISGYYGAIAAKEAIREKNIGRLMEYDHMLKKSDIYRYPYYWHTMRKEYRSLAGILEKMKGIQL